MTTLLDFLNNLDQDAAALEAFKNDPQAAMTQAGLSSAEQQAVLSGDKSALAKLAGVNEDEFPALVLVGTPFN